MNSENKESTPKPNIVYFHEFECMICEGHILVQAENIDKLHDESEWPSHCPFCGSEEKMILDSKHEVQLRKTVDVRTCGEQ
jgi:hypothetical protein